MANGVKDATTATDTAVGMDNHPMVFIKNNSMAVHARNRNVSTGYGSSTAYQVTPSARRGLANLESPP